MSFPNCQLNANWNFTLDFYISYMINLIQIEATDILKVEIPDCNIRSIDRRRCTCVGLRLRYEKKHLKK